MKGIDLFCASPASTAICVSLDKSSVALQSGRAIDRHNPHVRDSRRSSSRNHLKPPYSHSNSHSRSQSKPPTKPKSHNQNQTQNKTARKSSAKATDLISPPGSSRYLLSDTSFLDAYSDFDPISALVPVVPSRPLSLNPHDSPALKPSPSSSSSSSTPTFKPSSSSRSSLSSPPSPALKPPSSTRSSDQISPTSSARSHEQVVELKVSLHCKGCEGKVKKHISRMEGVTSFNIDFATKKVTVIGNVTPLDVLASISRVKNAQFWPSPSPQVISSY